MAVDWAPTNEHAGRTHTNIPGNTSGTKPVWLLFHWVNSGRDLTILTYPFTSYRTNLSLSFPLLLLPLRNNHGMFYAG